MKYNKLTPGQNLIWESYRIMLPKQVEEIKRLKAEKRKLPSPQLDDQELKRLGVLILDALRHGLELRVTYWHDGYYREASGVVDLVDEEHRQIRVELADGNYIYIKFEQLKYAERI
ncbi:YolD-like family protein [Halalkalibacter oceani]|uniref:YolD-like family protein n=1 Tax=Halalkalibacter oceani TaxID=1653776 RepID=UPI00339426A6